MPVGWDVEAVVAAGEQIFRLSRTAVSFTVDGTFWSTEGDDAPNDNGAPLDSPPKIDFVAVAAGGIAVMVVEDGTVGLVNG